MRLGLVSRRPSAERANKRTQQVAHHYGRRIVSKALRAGVAPYLDGSGHDVAALQSKCGAQVLPTVVGDDG